MPAVNILSGGKVLELKDSGSNPIYFVMVSKF